MKLVKRRNDGAFVFEREGIYFVLTHREILTFSFRFLRDLWRLRQCLVKRK